MVWVLLIAGFLVYLFLNTKNNEVNKVNTQGGMYVKYNTLISYFLEIPNIEIERKTSTSIILAVKDRYVVTRYTINHGFNEVHVFWNHTSIMFGEHSLHWYFPEYHPQEFMIATIIRDDLAYGKEMQKKIKF